MARFFSAQSGYCTLRVEFSRHSGSSVGSSLIPREEPFPHNTSRMDSNPTAHPTITAPPATSSTTPVIQPASPDARKTAACATSSGVPRHLSGWASTNDASCSLGMRSRFRSVRRLRGNAVHPNTISADLDCDLLGPEFDPSLRDRVRDRRPADGAQQPRRS